MVSYIGYATQEIKVDDQTTFNITLADDAQLLDEVVVIGYGTMSKRDLDRFNRFGLTRNNWQPYL